MLKDTELDSLARAVAALDRERALRKDADEGLELVWAELNQATEELERERARHAADAEALRAVIHHLRPGAAIVRVDEPTTGRHRYELWTNPTPKPAFDAAFLASVRGVPWTEEPKRTRDADLPATGTFHG
ncbi:hypothetical protein [Methylobacterium platani]|nr:hypothetical protein [Methylobacterium platani]